MTSGALFKIIVHICDHLFLAPSCNESQKKTEPSSIGQLGYDTAGNPAVSVKPVAFRPCLATGLALSCVDKNFYYNIILLENVNGLNIY
jgi:hypothetical protein